MALNLQPSTPVSRRCTNCDRVGTVRERVVRIAGVEYVDLECNACGYIDYDSEGGV